MTELTVETCRGGGYTVRRPDGSYATYLSGEETIRRDLADLQAIVEHIETEPEIPVGKTGKATVGQVRGVQVMRAKRPDDYLYWVSAEYVHGVPHHPDHDVTDFIPDELLTDETREQIKAEERKRIYGIFIDKFAASDSIDARTYVRFANWLKAGAR